MKKSILNIVLIATSIIACSISSCSKHGKGHVEDHHKVLNINYPAAYVVNGLSNNLSVIKLSDHTVSETIGLNGASYPHHIYMNPLKTKLAVAITSTDLSAGHDTHVGTSGGFKVQIIDVITGIIDKEIALSKLPHNAIFNHTGTELWLGQFDTIQSQVLIYKTSDYTLQNTINVGRGLSEITFSNDGLKAFACNTMDGTVTLIDASSKVIDTTLRVGNAPVGAWTGSNGKMYVDNEKSQTISEISVSGMTILSTILLGYKPGYVAYSGKRSELWVSNATNGKIVYYTLVLGAWTMQGDITTGADAHAIAFNNDGTIAYVTNQGAGSVSVIDMNTHKVSQTISVGLKPNGILLKQ
jgi:YVTN family beta-propeller protein